MRRFIGLVAIALGVVAVMPAVADAAPIFREHIHDVGMDIDPDFCGTGVAIDVHFDVVDNISFDPATEIFQASSRGHILFVNPETGDAVRLMFANRFSSQGTENPDGTFTVEDTFRGLPEKLQLPNGPVLLRDAGVAVFSLTFDSEGELVDEDIRWSGPHPELESDFALFCQVTTEALGIS